MVDENKLLYLKNGRKLTIPKQFSRKVDSLYTNGKEVRAFIHSKNLQDHQVHQRVLCLLNQLARYYQKPVSVACFSYRNFCSNESVYIIYRIDGSHYSSYNEF